MGEKGSATAKAKDGADESGVSLEKSAEKADKAEREKAEKAEKADKGERGAEKGERAAERPEREKSAPGADKSATLEKSVPADKSAAAAADKNGEGKGERARREEPSIPPLPAAGPWRSYKETVAAIASRIVEAQRPIRVLQSIRWDNSVEEQFYKSRFREIPRLDASYWSNVDLGFDPRAKAE
jgi:hypothetical protein